MIFLKVLCVSVNFGNKRTDRSYCGCHERRKHRRNSGWPARLASGILIAATTLFRRDGIRATGVERIAEKRRSQKRTLYQHISSKEELVGAYLRRIHDTGGPPNEQALDAPALARATACWRFSTVHRRTVSAAALSQRGRRGS